MRTLVYRFFLLVLSLIIHFIHFHFFRFSFAVKSILTKQFNLLLITIIVFLVVKNTTKNLSLKILFTNKQHAIPAISLKITETVIKSENY